MTKVVVVKKGKKNKNKKNKRRFNKENRYVYSLPSINDLPLSELRINIYNDYCQRKLVKCDPTKNPSTQCLSCIEFKAQCIDVSNKPLIHLEDYKDDSKNSFSQNFPPNTGVCLIKEEEEDDGLKYLNPFTTRIVPGTVRNRNNDIYLTTTTLCVNKDIVDKSIKIKIKRDYDGEDSSDDVDSESDIDSDKVDSDGDGDSGDGRGGSVRFPPKATFSSSSSPSSTTIPIHKAPCDKIRACFPHGLLLHPLTNLPIRNIEEIDFDISNSKKLKCACSGGYRSEMKKKRGYPTCTRNAAIRECSVKLTLWARVD